MFKLFEDVSEGRRGKHLQTLIAAILQLNKQSFSFLHQKLQQHKLEAHCFRRLFLPAVARLLLKNF